MAVPTAITDLSATIASNVPAGTDQAFPYLDDYLRAAYGFIRQGDTKAADVASAATVDLGAVVGRFVDVTGTTTITSFGTVAAGIWRVVTFTGALTLTHNATSLILPGGASITTAAGDSIVAESLGSGNWKVVFYQPAAGYLVLSGGTLSGPLLAASGSAAAPSLSFSGDTNTGIYRVAADTIGFSVGGADCMKLDSAGRLYSYVSYVAPPVIARSSIRYAGGGTEYGLLLTPVTDTTRAIHFTNAAGADIGSVSVNATGTTYNTTSDYRLKTDAIPLVGALDRVSKLRPCSYRWKSDGSAGEGFIAHELQEVIPLAVTGEKDGAEMQSVDYGRLTPLLAAAIQELMAENESMRARIAALEA